MKCPKCGMYHLDSAEKCDCGFDLKNQKTLEDEMFK